MKLNINWKELGIALWKAVWPVIAGAITGATVVTASGCSSMTPSSKTQTMSVVGIGLPAIAVITTSTQTADNTGDDTNAARQVSPVTAVIGK